jgi:hypothetical protein
MATTRIEVNEAGEFFTIIPEELVQDLMLEDGEQINWDENDGIVDITFG